MEIATGIIEFQTKGHNSIYDVTPNVREMILKEGFEEGQVCVSAIGSTTGISSLEFEPGLVNNDVNEMLEKVAPYGFAYRHNQTWGDDNGAAHLRSFLVNTSQNFPFVDGQLVLGTWQQIVFVDFDTRPRSRKVVIQLMGRRKRK